MSRTIETRSTCRYFSPSPSPPPPLRDSRYASPVRYTYIDRISHHPRYMAGKIGGQESGRGRKVDSYISSCSSSSSSPPRRTRSISILQTGRNCRQDDMKVQHPRRELNTLISYTVPRTPSSSPSPRSPKTQYTYRSTSASASDSSSCPVEYGNTGTSRVCTKCTGCRDGHSYMDGRYEDWEGYRRCKRRRYGCHVSPKSTSPTPIRRKTKICVRNLDGFEDGRKDGGVEDDHTTQRKSGIKLNILFSTHGGKDQKFENERYVEEERGRSVCRGIERERGGEGRRSIRNRTPTPYYEGFVRCRDRDEWRRGGGRICERDRKTSWEDRKRDSTLQYNYVSPNCISVGDPISRLRDREIGRERGREREKGRGRTPEIKRVVEYVNINSDRDMNLELDTDTGGGSRTHIHTRTRPRSRSRSQSQSLRRTRTKSRETKREKETQTQNHSERIINLTSNIEIPRERSLLPSRTPSGSWSWSWSWSALRDGDPYRDRDKDQDQDQDQEKHKNKHTKNKNKNPTHHPHHLSDIDATEGRSKKSTSTSKSTNQKRVITTQETKPSRKNNPYSDLSCSTSASDSDYTVEEIEREVRIRRRYDIDGNGNGRLRDRDRDRDREKGKGKEKKKEKERKREKGVRFMIYDL